MLSARTCNVLHGGGATDYVCPSKLHTHYDDVLGAAVLSVAEISSYPCPRPLPPLCLSVYFSWIQQFWFKLIRRCQLDVVFIIVTSFALIFYNNSPDPFWSVVDIFVAYFFGFALLA